MEITYLIKGIIIGIIASAPLGPVAVTCIQRTLHQGARAGFISGTGAVIADTFYATVACLGLSVISNFLIEYQFQLRFFGGLFLIFLGMNSFRKTIKTKIENYNTKTHSHFSNFISVFMLTIINPTTVGIFGLLFTSFGFAHLQQHHSLLLVMTGVFLGTVLWWLFVSTLVNRLRQWINEHRLGRINKIAGVLTMGFGIVVIASLFVK